MVVGDDLFTVATEVLERLLGGGGELVTAGRRRGRRRPGRAVRRAPRATRPTVDVVVYDGGQQRYPLLIGVE